MAALSDLGFITGIGDGILMPKLLSRFSVSFYVHGTSLTQRANEMTVLTRQIIRADSCQPLSFYSYGVVNSDRLRLVFEDDVTNGALKAVLNAGNASTKYDVVIEQLDGSDNVIERMCYFDAFFTQMYNNSQHDYAVKPGRTQITTDIDVPVIEGNNAEVFDILRTFVKSLNISVTSPNDNVDMCVTKTVELAYSKIEIRF